MSVETDVYDALTGDSTYNALITGGLWPGHIPDDATFPAAAYWLVTQNPMASNGVERSRMQVDNYSTDYSDTRDMRDALRDIVEGNPGWTFEIGPDEFLETDSLYHLIVDILVIKGV